jgi:phosphoglucosamine mutase
MGIRFGTDGVRGEANTDISVELVLALGRAVARVMPADRYLIGRDTRRSGLLLQAAISAGLAAEGVDVVDLGVLPTPGVAWLSNQEKVPAAVISASHNPFADNGVKFFAAGGLKLPDSKEAEIEAELARVLAGETVIGDGISGEGVGRLLVDDTASEHYIDSLVKVLGGRDLSGLRIAVDCANGAASVVGPEVLRRLGADVTVIADQPDGSNINAGCGSTHPEVLSGVVKETGSDLGLAFDGDADRLVAVDHDGVVRSGDELIALFASDLAERDQLSGQTVVVTAYSNLGLRHAMAERGISVRETPVGDRYILEALQSDGLSLGGEQSGHLVFRDISTTGDGILTAVLLADLVSRSGRTLSALASETMQIVPQLLRNLAVPQPAVVVGSAVVEDAIAEVEVELGENGRVLVRASGTEPLVRVMVEAMDHDIAADVADRLCFAVHAAVELLAEP